MPAIRRPSIIMTRAMDQLVQLPSGVRTTIAPQVLM